MQKPQTEFLAALTTPNFCGALLAAVERKGREDRGGKRKKEKKKILKNGSGFELAGNLPSCRAVGLLDDG